MRTKTTLRREGFRRPAPCTRERIPSPDSETVLYIGECMGLETVRKIEKIGTLSHRVIIIG